MTGPHNIDIVLGAGPAGLYAAPYYAASRGASTVVDSLEELAGQMAALYPGRTFPTEPRTVAS